MMTFRSLSKKDFRLPLDTVWLLNSISEYKGKQDLYTKQSPQILRSLVSMALVESVESSNRIEGITVDKKRLRPLVIGQTKPRDRSEEEIIGYRRALDMIHKKGKQLDITPNIFRELHKMSLPDVGDRGEWKDKDNDIIRRNPDGTISIIFKPISAEKVPRAVEELCLSYRYHLDQLKYPDLFTMACFILDFLCIHPFRDGNGRVSRLLTLINLYQRGYEVGRYISIERIIEQSKDRYYESLAESSSGWYECKHNIIPWVNYFLGTILSAYREFEQRTYKIKMPRGAKTGSIINAVSSEVGEFSISDIERACPGVSHEMIKIILRQLQRQKKIICLGKGKSAKWKRIG